jgi:hypothetical protein
MSNETFERSLTASANSASLMPNISWCIGWSVCQV